MHTCIGCSVAQSCPTLCNPWTIACKLLCLWGSPGKNTGVGLPCLPPGDLPRDPGIKPVSLSLAGKFFTTVPPGKPHASLYHNLKLSLE